MRAATPLAALLAAGAGAAAAADADDEALCRAHTAAHANETWRRPGGALAHPYLVPAGPYEQEWDWDAVFLGVATLPWGSRRYLEGSMLNFLAATNLSDGTVTGCLTREVPTVCSSDPSYHDALHHAKPIIIQGAWLASAAPGGDPDVFRPFAAAMDALLDYWGRPPRRDPATGLRVWHDQMESGADNGVLSRCPSPRSACWTSSQAFTLAAPDVMVLLHREHTAYALFADAWAAADRRRGGSAAAAAAARYAAAAATHRAAADEVARALDGLWRADLGYHAAYNTSSREFIDAPTYQIALPLWAGLANASQARAVVARLRAPDLLSPFGLRSASTADPRYSNADVIVPYSNWRGPMWVNVNALACYGLAGAGERRLAADLASRVVAVLAGDLRNTSQWHEAYSTDDGAALAAPGFLSWDTLSASLVSDVRAGRDPFRLRPAAADAALHHDA